MRNAMIIIVLALITSLAASPIAAGQILTIYTEHSPYAQYLDEDGQPKGYVYELVLEMQKIMQDSTPIHFVPWARGYQLALTQPNTALFSTTLTEERRPLFKWVGPVAETVWAFYAAKDSDIVIESLEDAKAVKRIGTYTGDVREAFLKEQGFTNLDSAPDNDSNLRKLIAGRITLWITSPSMVQRMAGMGFPRDSVKKVYTVDRKELFIAFNKDTSDKIVEQWAQAYVQVSEDGTMQAIFDRWGEKVPFSVRPSFPPELD